MKSKKREAKKRKSPFTPLREKAKAKENGPGANSTGPSRARARAYGRGGLKRCIDLMLDDAQKLFCGSARDRRVWAAILWREGPDRFLDAMFQAEAEIREHTKPVENAKRPRIFQAVLNSRFPKGGAK